jgi:hypothetical protein
MFLIPEPACEAVNRSFPNTRRRKEGKVITTRLDSVRAIPVQTELLETDRENVSRSRMVPHSIYHHLNIYSREIMTCSESLNLDLQLLRKHNIRGHAVYKQINFWLLCCSNRIIM